MADRDELDLLTGPDAADIVRFALAGPAGDGVLEGLHVEVDRVHHRPGAGVSVGYRVRYASAAGEVAEYLVASTARRIPDAPGVALLDDGERRVRVWRHPDDPALPGLREACDAATVGRWLHETGAASSGEPRLDLLAYRPTRRAVLRAASDDAVVFLKVVQPRRADALARRHALLADAGVGAPRVLSRPAAGVVAISRVPGRPLTEAVAAAQQDPGGLPGPDQLEDWLDSLPPEVVELSRRPSWADRVDFHAAAARAALPEQEARVDELELGIGALLSDAEPPVVPTHGDFYEANVFTDGGRVTGVIDVDSLGPGRRVDDIATLLGHLAVLPALAPAVYGHVPGLVGEWLEYYSDRLDPVALRARTAAVVLSLVAGTSLEQAHARLDVAEEWLRAGRREAAVRPAAPGR